MAEYCERMGKPHFKLYERFSQEKINPARWNEDFIEKELTKLKPNRIKKLWVCGPPVMNETFDRAIWDFNQRGGMLAMRQDQYEIL